MKAQASHRQLVSHADSEPSHPEPLMGGSGVRPGNLHFNAHLSGWDADLTLRARIRSFRNLACPSERHVEDRAALASSDSVVPSGLRASDPCPQRRADTSASTSQAACENSVRRVWDSAWHV